MNVDEHYDLVVYGATPGGIACAVRAAREGLSVILVSPYERVGGLLSNGLSTMDTLYNGPRAPLYDELRQSIHDHYRTVYGPNSEPYHRSLPGQPKTKFEAHVVEGLLERMLARESRLTLVRGFVPHSAVRHEAVLQAVSFRPMNADDAAFTANGSVFADCSYEGDLAAVLGVPCYVGRESREAYGEEHAGRIFKTEPCWPPPPHVSPEYIAAYRQLNLVHYDRWYDTIEHASTGEADGAVQAYNLRTVITNDPDNRVPIEKPAGYDRDEILRRLETDVRWGMGPPAAGRLPNGKNYLNMPQIIGLPRRYPEGDWPTRQHVSNEHARLTRSLLYFMQHDPSVPQAQREAWQQWGLPRDEFADNGHLPTEIYVREARRIQGRTIFTEHHARLAPGLRRAPICHDAISITEWFLDSHPCTPERVEGSMWEGELLLNHLTFPGQVSYRTILPRELDNLLVPVCLCATHIGWGAIRLEPTWMSIAEAAAHASVLAVRHGEAPAHIDVARLVRLLAERRVMLSFFNDVEVDPREPWVPAVQYLATQGFFSSYEADPLGPLHKPLAQAWAHATLELVRGEAVDVNERARCMGEFETQVGDPLTVKQFFEILSRVFEAACTPHAMDQWQRQVQLFPMSRISRGAACRVIHTLLAQHDCYY